MKKIKTERNCRNNKYKIIFNNNNRRRASTHGWWAEGLKPPPGGACRPTFMSVYMHQEILCKFQLKIFAYYSINNYKLCIKPKKPIQFKLSKPWCAPELKEKNFNFFFVLLIRCFYFNQIIFSFSTFLLLLLKFFSKTEIVIMIMKLSNIWQVILYFSQSLG